VRKHQVWCPTYEEVKLRSCYFPPKKEFVFNEIIHILQNMNISFGIDSAQKVPADWLIKCLSTLNPGHLYFDKAFYPEETKANAQTQVIDNSDGLFDNIRSTKANATKCTVKFEKEEEMEYKIGQLNNQIQNLSQQMNQLLIESQKASPKKSRPHSVQFTPEKHIVSNISETGKLVGSKRNTPNAKRDQEMLYDTHREEHYQLKKPRVDKLSKKQLLDKFVNHSKKSITPGNPFMIMN
jgi:hypothetical protein